MKSGVRILCVIMAAFMLLSFTSCSFLDKLMDNGQEAENTDNDPAGDPAAPKTLTRRPGVYTFMVINETASAGSLSSLFICALDATESGSASFLQINPGTYINNGGEYATLGALYSGVYSKAAADGINTDSARIKAIEALRGAISSLMSIPVDYYVCMDPDRISEIASYLGGINVTIPFSLSLSDGSSLSAGTHTVGSSLGALVTYSGFSASSALDIYKLAYAGIIDKARSEITSANISLFAMAMRKNVITDLPYSSGEDIFFIRKLLAVSSNDVCFTGASSQGCGISSGFVYVVHRSLFCDQIKDFLKVYDDPDFSALFDADQKLNDSTNVVVNTIYLAGGNLPVVYSLAAIKSGMLNLSFGG